MTSAANRLEHYREQAEKLDRISPTGLAMDVAVEDVLLFLGQAEALREWESALSNYIEEGPGSPDVRSWFQDVSDAR